ncbi:MAG: hypothetical protein RR702_05480 [Clostridia bacterium]
MLVIGIYLICLLLLGINIILLVKLNKKDEVEYIFSEILEDEKYILIFKEQIKDKFFTIDLKEVNVYSTVKNEYIDLSKNCYEEVYEERKIISSNLKNKHIIYNQYVLKLNQKEIENVLLNNAKKNIKINFADTNGYIYTYKIRRQNLERYID